MGAMTYPAPSAGRHIATRRYIRDYAGEGQA